MHKLIIESITESVLTVFVNACSSMSSLWKNWKKKKKKKKKTSLNDLTKCCEERSEAWMRAGEKGGGVGVLLWLFYKE